MKIFLILLCLACFAGCGKPMTNQEIIKEIKVCTDAGLGYYANRQGIELRIISIVCWGHLK